MARSQETFNKKEVRNKKEKKRKDKEKKRLERRDNVKEGRSFDDMIAYVDENGRLSLLHLLIPAHGRKSRLKTLK